jgi:hypothetical protein
MSVAFDPQRELARIRAEVREQRFAPFGDQTLASLVMLPVWTADLVERAHVDLGSASTPGELLDRAADAGIGRVGRGFDRTGAVNRTFTVADEMRRELIDRITDKQGYSALPAAVERTRDALRKSTMAGGSRSVLPPEVDMWLRVADTTTSTGEPARAFYDAVDQLVAQGDTGAALAWIRAGELLAPLLRGGLRSAVERAQRRVGQEYRAREDARFLERAVERHELVEAFTELLESDEYWALHYIGRGGVGKTMHIRYLAGPYAQARGIEVFPVARVDFDHISPHYPTRRPGELLRMLAEDLGQYVRTSEAESFYLRLAEARDRLGDGSDPGGDPLANLKTRAFEDALVAFVDFLGTLGSRQAVLVLDTCEELAKLHPAGVEVPAVEATFDIMERVRAYGAGRGLDVRTVFAGRRLLARGGWGWSVGDDAPAVSVSLQERPYLRMMPILGFTRDEAREFLIDKWDVDQGVVVDGVPVVDRILQLTAGESGFVYPGMPSSAGMRYNPFDLNVYAQWHDEGESLEALAAGGADPYVAVRILGRLSEEPAVCAAMSAVALLGRFDREMLAAGVEDADRVFSVLSEQEWMASSFVGEERWLNVDAGLLPRLRRYLRNDAPLDYERVRRGLAPGLARLARRPIGELSVDVVDAALRCLDDEDAAELWNEIAHSVAEGGHWGWAVNVAGSLLGLAADDPDTEAVVAARPALWPAIRLVHLDGSVIRDRTLHTPPVWAEVAARADDYASTDDRHRLRIRGRLGALAAYPPADDQWDDVRSGVAETPPERRYVAPVVGVLESLVERLAPDAADPVDDSEGFAALARDVGVWVSSVDAGPVAHLPTAMARVLIGRMLAAAGRDDEAAPWLEPVGSSWGAETGFPGWVVPEGPADRMVLEWLLALPMGAHVTISPQPLSGSPTIDSDRRLSAEILRTLDWETIPPGDLREMVSLARQTMYVRPTRGCHRSVPRLVAALARAHTAAGMYETTDRSMGAEQLLREAMSDIEGSRGTSVESDADRDLWLAVADLATRSRQAERWRSLLGRMSRSQDDELAPAAWAALALSEVDVDMPRLEKLPTDALRHGQWRVASDWLEPIGGDDPHLVLDRYEHAALGGGEEGGEPSLLDFSTSSNEVDLDAYESALDADAAHDAAGGATLSYQVWSALEHGETGPALDRAIVRATSIHGFPIDRDVARGRRSSRC